MKLYLVRPAHAEARAAWSGGDRLRPLTARGERQAHALERALDRVPLSQIYSDSSLRSRETVDGLAIARGLSVESEDRLDPGTRAEEVLELLEEGAGGPTLLCASRRLIEELLVTLGVGEHESARPRCQKGSLWRLVLRGRRVVRAEYEPPRELEAQESPFRRWAVLDLGSTSFSLAVVDLDREGDWVPILRERATFRLGAHASADAAIPPEDCRRAVEAVRRLREEAENVGCEAIFPVATAIFRDAANAPALVSRMDAALGQPIRLLSGDEEARLAYAAIQHRLGIESDPLLAVDLGGGSLELATGCGARVDRTATLPLGVTRLRSELVSGRPDSRGEERAIRERVREVLNSGLPDLALPPSLRLAGAGGTLRAIARLTKVSSGGTTRSELNGAIVTQGQLEEIFERLRDGTKASKLGIPARRADLLPVGALVLSTLLSVLGIGELVVSDWGLREGVLLEALARRRAFADGTAKGRNL